MYLQGDLRIANQSVTTTCPNIRVTQLELQKVAVRSRTTAQNEEKRTVKHVQCLCWPDHGTPEKSDYPSILALCHQVKEAADAATQVRDGQEHIIVHCR